MGRNSKYFAVKVEYKGLKFDSKKEFYRYLELNCMEKKKEISGLERQVPFHIDINGVRICKYIADFTYFLKNGDPVVEDVKGFRTAIYKLKKKMMRACHGITIKET